MLTPRTTNFALDPFISVDIIQRAKIFLEILIVISRSIDASEYMRLEFKLLMGTLLGKILAAHKEVNIVFHRWLRDVYRILRVLLDVQTFKIQDDQCIIDK